MFFGRVRRPQGRNWRPAFRFKGFKMGATSDWCSAPCRPDGLLSLDMPVQSASGLHSLGYCPSAVDPAHEKTLMKPHAGGIQKYTSVAPEHEEHSIMIIREKRSSCTPDGPQEEYRSIQALLYSRLLLVNAPAARRHEEHLHNTRKTRSVKLMDEE